MRRASLILAALLVAGCAALANRPAEVRTYRMAYLPPEPVGTAPLPVTVRVAPFGVAAVYDRQSFLYREGPYDISADYYSRWIASPGVIVSDLIARDLATSGMVKGVIQSASALAADYEISGHIDTLEERDEDGCSAHVRLRIVLTRVPPRAPRYIVVQKGFVADEPCQPGDPASYAAAVSLAVERISSEIRALLAEAIPRDQRDGPQRGSLPDPYETLEPD